MNRALLAAGALAIALFAAFDWLSIKTQRLYLERSANSKNQSGGLQQRFVQKGDQVAPEIIISDREWNKDRQKWVKSDEAHFSFPIRLSTPHKLVFTAIPTGNCGFEIYFNNGAERRPLVVAKNSKPEDRMIVLAPCAGRLEFVVHGKMVWVDLRLSRRLFLWPLYAAGLVVLGTVSWKSRGSGALSPGAVNWLTLAVSLLVSLTAIELLLRNVALKLPAPILQARHDLGLVVPDPRMAVAPKFEYRLRPNVKVYLEWRFGDIVRTGVIPESAAPGVLHRYWFETDAEGFRNPTLRAKVDVAALGDSFTDAMTLPASDAWPAQLEKLTGWTVGNYGTTGYGPQQELYVLRDYAIQHRPRITVLAFFAGNDLYDSMRFDQWERGAGQEPGGWKITDSFRNYETLYLWSIARVTGHLVGQRIGSHTGPRQISEITDADVAARAYFDEGVFHIPVLGKVLHFAWMPPYALQLATPRFRREQERGWALTRQALIGMKNTCAENGSRFVLMLVPTTPQVYWPLVERSLDMATLQKALDFYSHAWSWPSSGHVDVDKISPNRLALNEMVAGFCAQQNIPMLDLTPALQKEFEAGTPVYFFDDAHWNATGHAIAAKELARFLQSLP